MSAPIIYEEHLSEPWFTLITLGLKTYEGRLYKNRFQNYKVGDIVIWHNEDFGKKRTVKTEIVDIKLHRTFRECIKYCTLEKILPGMPNMTHGLGVYFKYFKKEDEKKYGVVAFELNILI